MKVVDLFYCCEGVSPLPGAYPLPAAARRQLDQVPAGSLQQQQPAPCSCQSRSITLLLLRQPAHHRLAAAAGRGKQQDIILVFLQIYKKYLTYAEEE